MGGKLTLRRRQAVHARETYAPLLLAEVEATAWFVKGNADVDATGCIADISGEKAPDADMVQEPGVRVGEGLRVPSSRVWGRGWADGESFGPARRRPLKPSEGPPGSRTRTLNRQRRRDAHADWAARFALLDGGWVQVSHLIKVVWARRSPPLYPPLLLQLQNSGPHRLKAHHPFHIPASKRREGMSVSRAIVKRGTGTDMNNAESSSSSLPTSVAIACCHASFET